MTIKSADQVTILDITDAYSVLLSNESHTFIGGTDSALAGTAVTNVYAFQGDTPVAVTIGTIANVTGLSANVSNNGSVNALITFTATTALKTGGTIDIPVTITGTEITITKKFTYGISFAGKDATPLTITSKSVTYQVGSSGTTAPTGTWGTTVPVVNAGQYLWTKTTVVYSDGNKTESYSVSYKAKDGNNATPLTITTKKVTYQVGNSGTTKPTGTWLENVPAVAQGKYLWTKTYIKYSDNTETESYSVSYNAVDGYTPVKGKDYFDGEDGADAISITITTDNGNIFKNSEGNTTLTAHVYKAGAELTAAQISTLGTLKWYKDGGTTAVETGATLTVAAASVTNKAVYTVQLEG